MSYPPVDIKQKILEATANEQEQLARILTALASKVEKTAKWLPKKVQGIPDSAVIDKTICLEQVIAKEIEATSSKEKAITKLIEEFCDKQPHHCPTNDCDFCPCELFQACKFQAHCFKETWQ